MSQSKPMLRKKKQNRNTKPDLASSLISHSRAGKTHYKNTSLKAQALTEASLRSAVR